MTITLRKLGIISIGLTVGLGGCQRQDAETQPEPAPLQQTQQQPDLAAPKTGPKLPDFGSISDVKTKKRAFFDYLQPMIEQENLHIQQLRDHVKQLEALIATQEQLHPDDNDWLAQAAKLYRIDGTDPAQQLGTLDAKLGKIPAALVKAQAANESAWGTSRFARQANNLFGQWCFSPGCGIAPLQRNPDDTHEVQAFSSVAAGLRSYFVNLNGNKSYANLRQIRRCLQDQQQPYSGRALAAGLVNYSARGGHYVDELQSMIRINQLESWDADWWGDADQQHPCYPLVQVLTDHPDPVVAIEETEIATDLALSDAETSVAISSIMPPASVSFSSASQVQSQTNSDSLTVITSAAPASTTATSIPELTTTPAASHSPTSAPSAPSAATSEQLETQSE
ncbi:MAG: glucosaminidase domain-containing protein [Halopseudomonas sp.]